MVPLVWFLSKGFLGQRFVPQALAKGPGRRAKFRLEIFSMKNYEP
jgi:hypothetical protein